MASSSGHLRYPKKVSVNFRKLEERSLWNYVALHNIELEGEKRPTKEELEIICAEHFAEWEVDEDKVVESWIANMSADRDCRELGAVRRKHRSEFTPYGPYGHGEAPDFGSVHNGGGPGGGMSGALDANRSGVVPVGEQVAAQYCNTNENGSWILAEIVRYLAGRGCYEVKDADDETKTLQVPADGIIRLRDGGEGFAKGDHVLAVFPDTTSFYRATISKQPVRKGGTVSELVVQFEDDEDETGKTPHRRINAKLVLPQPDPPYYDDYRGAGGNHSVYEEPQPQHSSRWGANDDGGRRGGYGVGGASAYDADGYYPPGVGDDGGAGGGVGGGGGGGGGGAWDDDLARPPKKTKRRMMTSGASANPDLSRAGGSRGGNRGMSTGFR